MYAIRSYYGDGTAQAVDHFGSEGTALGRCQLVAQPHHLGLRRLTAPLGGGELRLDGCLGTLQSVPQLRGVRLRRLELRSQALDFLSYNFV